jgi:heparinase II/III-like protein
MFLGKLGKKTKRISRSRIAIFCCMAFALLTQLSFAALPANSAGDDILATLRRGHPRLYLLDSDLPDIKQAIERDAAVKAMHDNLETEAEKMLAEPPAQYKLIGPRLLSQSRAALRRISTLAGLYRLDGDRRKAERAREELLAISAFPDWHPPHFLDTAEMTHAAAIGYDWLYHFLSVQDRAVIRGAIVTKGLQAGLKVYAGGRSWTKTPFNWNQVCNGGMTLGALAIADEEPKIAREVLEDARASVPHAMASFAPDGGWAEGPGYWDYATAYNVYYLAALETALGKDFGFTKLPGFSDAGLFRLHAIGPLGLTFNYADAEPHAGTAAQMFWMAKEFNRPVYAWGECRVVDAHPTIFHLIWVTRIADWPCGKPEEIPLLDRALPRDAFFRGVNVATFRSSWDDPNAFYLGLKGGDNKANHSHLDLGTFVFDALGERWAVDLGPDDYNLPEYFRKLRFSYYRLRTEGHNTLTFGRENQNPDAKAPIVAFLSSPNRAFTVADLTAGYVPRAREVRRGVALLDRSRALIEDEVQMNDRTEVVWNFHTRAEIKVDGSHATLSLGGKQIEARILSPESAHFEVFPADPPPPQAQQPDVHNLKIRLPGTTEARIAVVLEQPGESRHTAVEPLDAWIAAANGCCPSVQSRELERRGAQAWGVGGRLPLLSNAVGFSRGSSGLHAAPSASRACYAAPKMSALGEKILDRGCPSP